MNVPVSQSLDLIFQVLEKKSLTKEKLKKFSHDLFNKSVYLLKSITQTKRIIKIQS